MNRRWFLAGAAALLVSGGVAEARLKAGPIDAGSGHRLKSAAVVDTMRTSLGAVYSFRKVVPTYAGPAVKLRRTTGGTLDIGFVGSDYDAAAAATFCVSTTCFVDTWYDQTSLGRHAVQATTANQPAFILDCGNGKPCIRSTLTNQILQSASVTWAANKTTLSVVGRRTAGTTTRCYMLGKGNALLAVTSQADSWVMTDFVTEYTFGFAAPENIWHAAMAVFDGAAALLRVDDVEQAAGTVAGSASGGTSVLWNGGSTCEISEGIIWDNYATTQSERVALSNNQRDYWIPLPLDSFVNPVVAYSLRRLKTSYSGPAVRLRRASDNLETDINFLGYVPGLGAPVNVAAANAHCVNTSCFIAKWYDQIGVNDMTSDTLPHQWAFVFNCIATLPCVRSTTAAQIIGGPATLTVPTTITMNAVGRQAVRPAPGGFRACSYVGTGGNLIHVHADYDILYLVNGVNSITAGPTYPNWHSMTGVMSPSGGSLLINALPEVTGTMPGATGAGANVYVYNPYAETCDETEVITWFGYALTAGERATLHANQKSFWGF